MKSLFAEFFHSDAIMQATAHCPLNEGVINPCIKLESESNYVGQIKKRASYDRSLLVSGVYRKPSCSEGKCQREVFQKEQVTAEEKAAKSAGEGQHPVKNQPFC